MQITFLKSVGERYALRPNLSLQQLTTLPYSHRLPKELRFKLFATTFMIGSASQPFTIAHTTTNICFQTHTFAIYTITTTIFQYHNVSRRRARSHQTRCSHSTSKHQIIHPKHHTFRNTSSQPSFAKRNGSYVRIRNPISIPRSSITSSKPPFATFTAVKNALRFSVDSSISRS